MRRAYAHGAPGALVSGTVWLAAAAAALTLSATASVWVLLGGGMAIFPLSLLVCRALGAPGKHSAGNPLGLLAVEGTLWLMAGIFIAWATTFSGIALFFPVMLLVIGSRYLTFQSIYGLRAYWFAGSALCMVGLVAPALNLPAFVAAAAGGGIELVLGGVLLSQRR